MRYHHGKVTTHHWLRWYRSLRLVQMCSSPASSNNGHRHHLEVTDHAERSKVMSSAEVVSVMKLSQTVTGFTLRVADQRLTFKAGQWLDLFIPGVEVVGGYSICSPPHQLVTDRTLQLAIKSSPHTPTLWMCTQCKVGDKLSIRVGGDYYYDPPGGVEHGRHLLFIAGGIGINPILSMVQHHVHLQTQQHDQTDTGRVQVLYSTKSRDELVFCDQLAELARSSASLMMSFYITREKSTANQERSDIKYHRINRDDLEQCLSRLQPSDNLTCYLCGPQQMVDMITTTLEQLGVKNSQINSEKWW
ncbi:oxidoreductase NAD-binding domain-containing protein 1-like [Dysidea avara]|uniref:oxidoreductase NAD-binding domain-containing protein 1-like n=1 Tax=Dysidea avara TaxID=196820 RepID=UPI003326220E